MRICILLMVFTFLSCQSQKADRTTIENPLVGEWRNLSLRVELDKQHGESTSVFEVDEATWEGTLQIRPIRTYFRSGGNFNSEHYNLEDSLIMNPEGTWTATEEEILMITTKPFSDSTTCTYAIKDNVATFGCWVDWDEDGEKDDWYVGTQKKQ